MADYSDLGFAPAPSNLHADLGFEPAPQAQPNPSLNATISAEPKPQGIREKVSRWAQNVMDDIKYGTDLTGVGSVLKKMGAHGVYNGAPEAVGDYMASLPLGLLRATKGAAEITQPGHFMEGAKDTAAGALQAGDIPLSFVGAPAGAKAAETAAAKVAEVIPNAERAGKAFSQVKAAAGDLPINVNLPGSVALRAQEIANAGDTLPKVIGQFLRRVTDPDKGALTYSEARDFYSNATRKLAPDESLKRSAVMRAQIAQFTHALGAAISDAADRAGQLENYQNAMQEYHRAMRLRALGQNVKDVATSTLGKAAAGAVGGAAAYQVGRDLLQK